MYLFRNFRGFWVVKQRGTYYYTQTTDLAAAIIKVLTLGSPNIA